MNNQLNQLRAELVDTQNHLIDAEAELTDRLAEINAFEFEARVAVKCAKPKRIQAILIFEK